MDGSRGMLMPAAVICAASAFGGCTVYTEPPRVTARAGASGRAVQVAEPVPPRSGARVGVGVGAGVEAGAGRDGASLSVFYQALAPAGQWIDAPVCGAYRGRVWNPDPWVVGRDFVPFQTSGEWVETDLGWAFASDFDWGWATFHYGRWCDDQRFGWVWVPGDEWAPAWVDWRQGGGYVGWAPLPPSGAGARATTWIFVEAPHFAGGRVARRVLTDERAVEARRATRPVRRVVRRGLGYTWYAGPDLGEIRGSQGRPVHVAPPARGDVRRVIVRRH